MESGPTLVPDPNDDHGALPAVRDFLVEMSIREMELPHIVLSHEAGGGCVCFSGPYPTAMEALVG